LVTLVTNTNWSDLSTEAYCWYNNDQSTYGDIYGALYNWYAVNTGKLCPTGWHVPSDIEWQTLVSFLGSNAGGKLKETGTSHWDNPNTGATNESGFTALPGGHRSWTFTAEFNLIGQGSLWWSSRSYNIDDSAVLLIWSYDSNVVQGPLKKKSGLSVRCLKD